MSQNSQVVVLAGGLDLVTPAMMKRPGVLIACDNYECEARGYRRSSGYERFDGRPAPSKASYLVVLTSQGADPILAGDTVTGQTSGATGIALKDSEVTSGSYTTDDAAGRLTLHATTGTFTTGEFLQVGGLNKMRADDAGTVDGAATDEEHRANIDAVTAWRRAQIQAPGGSGPIRGVAIFRGDVYSWRDNATGTAGLMYKATPTGWALQTFGYEIEFTEGQVEFLEGETITGGTSLATATVERVQINAGAWNASLPAVDEAKGNLILSGVTGTFVDGEALNGNYGGTAKAVGTADPITLPAGAAIEWRAHNFYATDDRRRLYFTTGAGRAHEWDGTVLAPIYTGVADALDTPQRIAVFGNSLILTYDGGSLQGSSPGSPLDWNGAHGAFEIGFGQDITALKDDVLNSLIVAGRSKLAYLVGTDSSNFEMRPISDSSGAFENTMQTMGRPIYLDDLGVRSLDAAETYGDWRMGTMTHLIEPLMRSKKESEVQPVGSLRVKSKDQYRLFYADRTFINIYMGRKSPEVMTSVLGFTPSTFTSGEDDQGFEVIFAGGDDGQVYQLDSGTSFDGEIMRAYIRLSFLNQGAPNLVKRYHRASLEGTAGDSNTALLVAGDFSYGDEEQPATQESGILFYGSGGFWGSALWNEFYWSAQVEGQAWMEMDGIGENVSLVIASESTTETPHTLSTITINWTPRRSKR